MKKHKFMKIIPVALAAPVLTSIFINLGQATNNSNVAKTNSTTSNADSYTYSTIPLTYDSFTGPLVMGNYVKQDKTETSPYKVQAVDQGGYTLSAAGKVEEGTKAGEKTDIYDLEIPAAAGWWVEGAFTNDTTNYRYTGDPSIKTPDYKKPLVVGTDGNITISSTNSNTSGLNWQMPYSTVEGKANNGIALHATAHPSHTLQLKTPNSFAKIYLLTVAANKPKDVAKVKVTVNYTTGDPKEAYFNIYDWCADTTKDMSIANASYSRIKIDKNGLEYGDKYGADGAKHLPYFFQCELDGLDTTRIVKSIDVSLESTNDLVVTIYGASGAYAKSIKTPDPNHKDVKQTTATITWDAIPNAAKYYLDVYQYSDATTSNSDSTVTAILNNQEVDGTATSYNLTGLDSGETYYYRMRAETASHEPTASSNEKNFTTLNELTIKDPTNVTSSSFQANWEGLTSDEQSNITTLQLRVSDSTDFSTYDTYDLAKTATTQSITSYQGNSLQPDTNYYYCLYATYTGGYIESTYATAHTTIPAASLTLSPTTLKLLTGNSSYVTSSVKSSDNKAATDQTVTWTNSDDTVATVTAGSSTSHLVTSTKPGVTTLTAKSKDGGYTATCGVTVVPNAPTIGDGSSTHNTVTAAWTAPSEVKTDSKYTYTVQLSDKEDITSGTVQTVSGIAYNTLTNTFTNLSENTDYYVRVKTVYNGTYESDWSSIKKITTNTLDVKSISLTAGGQAISSATISIDSSKDIKSTIYMEDGSVATNQEVEIECSKTGFIDVTTTNYQNHNIKPKLANNTAMTLTFKAKADPTITATLTVNVTLPKPTLSIGTVTSDSIQLNWNDNSSWVQEYIVSYAKEGSNEYKAVSQILSSATTYTLTDLEPNTKYYFYVSAMNNGQYSTSDELNTSTLPQKANGIHISESSINTILGETNDVTSKLIGTTKHDATDQTVKSEKIDGTAEVDLTDNVTQHTIKAKTEGTAKIKYTAESDETIFDYVNVNVKSAVSKDPTNIKNTSFVANWENVGAQKYYIDVATDNEFKNILPDYNNKEVLTNSLEITGLQEKTQYFYRVRYYNNGYTSVNSNVKDATLTSGGHHIWDWTLPATVATFTILLMSIVGYKRYKKNKQNKK